jgi:hypothetical protein
MKRIRLFSSVGLLIVLLYCKVDRVRAEGLKGCLGHTPTLMSAGGTDLKPQSGITLKINILGGKSDDAGKNFVVLGQDPEEEGFSVNVTISAIEGIMVYDEMVPEQICVDEKGNEKDEKYCKDPEYYGYLYHYTTREKCHSGITSPANRTIANGKVWLKPSLETAEWLGWVQTSKIKKAALRYLFPEKWMVGTWTEDGFTTIGTPDLTWSETYYQNWLQQMEGYNFLAGDTATLSNLWSVTLVEVTDPDGNQSLGIFGNFNPGTYLNPYPSDYSGGVLNISYDKMNSHTEKQ